MVESDWDVARNWSMEGLVLDDKLAESGEGGILLLSGVKTNSKYVGAGVRESQNKPNTGSRFVLSYNLL